MSTETRYVVKEDRTVRPLPEDDFERVPCWTVTRVTAGMAWHIGKYKTEQAAQKVAGQLTKFIADEID